MTARTLQWLGVPVLQHGVLLHLPSMSNRVGVSEIVDVNPVELEAALKRDSELGIG